MFLFSKRVIVLKIVHINVERFVFLLKTKSRGSMFKTSPTNVFILTIQEWLLEHHRALFLISSSPSKCSDR